MLKQQQEERLQLINKEEEQLWRETERKDRLEWEKSEREEEESLRLKAHSHQKDIFSYKVFRTCRDGPKD